MCAEGLRAWDSRGQGGRGRVGQGARRGMWESVLNGGSIFGGLAPGATF